MSYPPDKRTLVKRDAPLESKQKKKKKTMVLVRKTVKAEGKFKRAPVPVVIKPIHSYLDEQGRGICPSCSKKVHFTELRDHLESEHRFTKAELDLLDAKVEQKSIWVQIWQGGLPGLGKNR